MAAAARFAGAAHRLAIDLGDARSRALALRAGGHLAFLKGAYGNALEQFRKARGIFHRLGADLDEARTLSSSLQALIYLGRYGEALRWADRAREIFTKHGDRLRLARLDLNVANVLYRQDRFEDAHHLYETALREFRRRGDAQDVAAALENRAVCEISLNDFDAALRSYSEVRAHCVRHRLPLLVAVADYNIAYLFFLRGEYTRAIELYDIARARARSLGDAYHEALCDLDESEMLLQLNLVERAATLAERAYVRFERLGTWYEAAKALLFLALAARRQGHTERALPLFVRARRLFVREENRVWPFLIDLYQAVLLHEEGRLSEAERLGRTAHAFFSKTTLTEKAALCELLLARVALTRGRLARAQLWAARALRSLERVDAPAPLYQVLFVLGQIREAQGDAVGAYRMYRRARTRLEGLRGQLGEEELKIAFLKDKLEVYERLVELSLSPKGAGVPSHRETAFGYIEEAKSRSLADQISFRAHLLPGRRSVNVRAVERVHRLREELHFVERRMALSEADLELGSEKVRRRLLSRAREIEAGLFRELTRLRGREDEFRALQNAGTLPL
ncbi:MAG TPA: tetratricopeptide repeat protein, partial [Thermoanaerobaculia bacterium]